MQYTRNGLLFPESFDLVREGADIIEQLCRAIDPEPTAMSVTMSSGWTADPAGSALITHIGPFVYWRLALTRSGAAITTDASGNIVSDIPVFTGLADPYKPYRMSGGTAVATSAPVRCVKSFNHEIAGFVDQTGACYLTHGWPSQTFATGAGYQFTAFYLLNF